MLQHPSTLTFAYLAAGHPDLLSAARAVLVVRADGRILLVVLGLLESHQHFTGRASVQLKYRMVSTRVQEVRLGPVGLNREK
jgi:hypothetical protein